MPELTTLGTALEALDAWQAHAQAALAVRTPLEDLQQLVDEAEALPATVPELASVRVWHFPTLDS